MVNEALLAVQDAKERESLLALQSELKELIQLTQESLDALVLKENTSTTFVLKSTEVVEKSELDDEYALFMVSNLASFVLTCLLVCYPSPHIWLADYTVWQFYFIFIPGRMMPNFSKK